jgi:hypothetical protein
MERPCASLGASFRPGGLVRIDPPRFVLAFLAGAVGIALVAGIPTDVIPNDLFTRMTPVRGYDVPVLVAISVLGGLLAASYWGVSRPACAMRRAGTAGGVGATLGWLAIGCPVCNKIVVLALGTSGALNVFGPAQPWLAALSVTLLVVALTWRWRMLLAADRAGTQPMSAG